MARATVMRGTRGQEASRPHWLAWRVVARLAALVLPLNAAAACQFTSEPCVPGLGPNQTYRVELIDTYTRHGGRTITDASPDPSAPPPRDPSCAGRDGLLPGTSLVLTTTKHTRLGLPTCHYHLATAELNDTMRAQGFRPDPKNARIFTSLHNVAALHYVAPGQMSCGELAWRAQLGTFPGYSPDLFATYTPSRDPHAVFARSMVSASCQDYCEDLFVARVTRLDADPR